MATTTTNFGWDIPQSTDLVKDGATAIAALGQDIDTALVDLKGGTTGQVLSKNSNTDMDFTWVTDAAGDITGVTAGTGISGGGTSGTVTVTNAMATAIDAKGDLIAGTGADAFSRLAVGTNGQVLTADSTAATGLAWAAGGGSSGPAFNAIRNNSSGNQSISNGVTTKVALTQERFDTDSCFDSTTNYRFTPNKAGYYQLNCTFGLGGSITHADGSVFINGSEYWRLQTWNNTNAFTSSGGNIIYFNGTTDYAEMFVYMTGTSLILYPDYYGVAFSGVWIRS